MSASRTLLRKNSLAHMRRNDKGELVSYSRVKRGTKFGRVRDTRREGRSSSIAT
jgi:hypothetical protein